MKKKLRRMSLQNVPETEQNSALKSYIPLVIKIVGAVAIIVLLVFGIQRAIDTFAPSSGVDGAVWVPTYSPQVGDENSKVTVVIFYDLQCPACADNNAKFENIVDAYKDRVHFVYRSLPLDSIHPLARLANKGAHAAYKQGYDKFLAYKAEVYATQSSISPNSIENAASVAGLDVDQWNRDRNSKSISDEVDADKNFIDQAVLPESTFNGQTKASGTPTTVVLVDGNPKNWWTGSQDEEVQKSQIEMYLSQSNQSQADSSISAENSESITQ